MRQSLLILLVLGFTILSCCMVDEGNAAFGASQAVRYKISGELKGLIEKKAVVPEKTKVIFYLRDPKMNLTSLKSRGCKILNVRGKMLTAEVPTANLEDILDNVEGIEYARRPRKFIPLEITSEGVNLSQSNALHSAGITGRDVKIAVIDVGFKGLSAAKSNGEIPANVTTYDFTGTGLETEHKHGTAVAEIVHDMAPDAELHLLKIDDEVDLADAAVYCKNNNINIINISLGTFGTGPGNGTGYVDEICDDLKVNGILVVAAAGNASNTHAGDGTPIGSHWQGAFLDSGYEYPIGSNNRIHQFIPGDPDSYFNVIYTEPSRDDDNNPESNEVTVIMRWDDWPNANVDYDMYLLDENWNLVASSTDIQNGTQQPLETIVVDVPDSVTGKIYILLVTRKSGEPPGKDIEIMLAGNCIFAPLSPGSQPIATSSSSIFEPADAQSVLAVGAINYNNWAAGPQEDYSSQGPTNAWAGSSARIKPDICGPDRTSSYTYGASAFPGTSAATPHVAGAAALILSMHPQYSTDQLRSAVETNAIDMGSFGKDNLYGNGRLKVDTSLNTRPVLDWTGEAGYVGDGLEPEIANSLTPLTFKIKYKDAEGDAPLVHDLYLDKNGDGDYADAGEVISTTPAGSDYKAGVIYTCTTSIPYSAGSNNCSYYFKFSDALTSATGNITQAISPQTAINKPDIFQTLSVTIDHNSWQLSGIPAGSSYITDSANKIKISNNGDGPQTYSLRITSEGNGWSSSMDKNGAGINKFVLSALFSQVSQTSIDSSYFNEIGSDDVILSSGASSAGLTNFGSSHLSEGGFSVPAGLDRNLWLEFKAPTRDTTLMTQPITMTINAEAS